MRNVAITTTTLGFALVFAAAARADITVCNEFDTTIHVAFASQVDSGYSAAGWWTVGPNDCQTTDYVLQGDTLYYTADSDSYRNGRGTAKDHWGNVLKLYVSKNQFTYPNADQRQRGAKTEMFSSASLAKPNDSQTLSVTVHFKSGGTSIESKTTAKTAQ